MSDMFKPEPTDSLVSGARDERFIQDSWKRCKDEYKISPQSNIELTALSEKEIREKREPLNKLLSDSVTVFDKIRRVAKHSGYSVLVSDADGVTVKSFTDSDLALEMQSHGIRQGTLWQESIVGTNALGTCLKESSPVTVYAHEHYGSNLQSFSCSAAPLIAPDGNIFGALDMSTYAAGNRLSQALALNLVSDTADEIEALMFRDAYHNQNIVSLAVSARPALSTALVAFNDSGTIVAATTPALLALNCRDRYDLVARNFEEAFSVGFEQIAAASPLHHRFALNGSEHQYHLSLVCLKPQASPLRNATTSAPLGSPAAVTEQSCPLLSAAGEEPQLIKQAQRCQRIVDRGINTLLQGETGTGKEVWARALHNSSRRRDKPFITLNCAAIPESLIESELFGYGAGTFTGGLKSGKAGKIEASNGGTLFLDEIGDMPIELQARLLRVLAESEIIPLGEVEPIPIDINVICATHRDLQEYVARGEFREDLYYRISAFRVALPPLRERQDQRYLFTRILQQLSHEESEAISLSPQAESALRHYPWPGNIRQLKNVLQYAICMRETAEIQVDDLPEELFQAPACMPPATQDSQVPPARMVSIMGESAADSAERQQLIAALEQNRWIVTRTAKTLGVSRSTLHRKIKKFGLLLEPEEG